MVGKLRPVRERLDRPSVQRGDPAGSPPTPDAKVVLFVDDEPDILELVRIIMEETLPGVQVRTAPSGPAAIQLLREEAVDLVVSDFRMPLMDGIEFLAIVRRIQPLAGGVLFSAYADPGLAERAFREAGARAVYSKADGIPELITQVEALLVARATQLAR